MTIMLRDITLSSCSTHHLINEKPLYAQRFKHVLKYHEPGAAPVLDQEGAYHIDLKGAPIYSYRFKRTFGFYEDRAAIETDEGWSHILLNGESLYPERYAWCGNFQEGLCAVQDKSGFYFHITLNGEPLYAERYAYVGDFKEGCAVVCNENGQHTHIDKGGECIHSIWFDQLDVFHKGYAKARDHKGWSHIDKKGNFLYDQRYVQTEPFYNGFAYSEDFDGRRVLINEQGKIVKIISESQDRRKMIHALSANMVGFWKTWTLYAAIDLNILECLPNSTDAIAQKANLPKMHLERLLKALWELEIIEPTVKNMWELTEKGRLLVPTQHSFLAPASLMWGRVNNEWEKVSELLKQPQEKYRISFKEKETDPTWIDIYQRALKGYAEIDFESIVHLPLWSNHHTLLGIGRCAFSLLPSLQKMHPHLRIEMLETSHIIHALKQELPHHISTTHVDAIIFPRFLHYFPDQEALILLQKSKHTLLNNGKIYIIEMLLEENAPSGGLLNLNMFVETGGKIRTLKDWERLLEKIHLHLTSVQKCSPLLNVLTIEVK